MAEKRRAQPKGGYHHGDLRNAVIEHSLKLLEEHGVDALSLRIVARDLGVSQPAPYHHFADRNELLAALAAKGFERLASGLQSVPADPRERTETALSDGIAALMRGYVRFAQHRPHLFRVMFSRPAADRVASPELKKAAGESFRALARQVDALLNAAGIDSGAQHAAATIWSLQHGLASLVLDGGTSAEASETLAHADSIILDSAETVALGLLVRARNAAAK